MNTRSLLLVFMVFGFALTIAAQKTVTNTDLERYRTERVRSEDELRQQYATKGLTTDEVMRRNKESQTQLFELSARLRAERIEAERIQAEREAGERAAEARRRATSVTFYDDSSYWRGGWFGTSGFVGPRRFGARPIVQHGYFAGGQFWPSGAVTPPHAVFNVGRRH